MMPRLYFLPVACSLSSFLTITYFLCIFLGLILPALGHQFRQVLEMLLPGFKWFSFGGFLNGLFWSIFYGVYTGVLFVPLYNYFSRKTLPNRDEYSSRLH